MLKIYITNKLCVSCSQLKDEFQSNDNKCHSWRLFTLCWIKLPTPIMQGGCLHPLKMQFRERPLSSEYTGKTSFVLVLVCLT